MLQGVEETPTYGEQPVAYRRAKRWRGRVRNGLDRTRLCIECAKRDRKERVAWSEFLDGVREEYFAFAFFETEPGSTPTRFYSLVPG